MPGLSRRQARVLLDIGGVFVDKRRIKIAGRAMHAGEEVVAVLGGALARATGRTGRRRAKATSAGFLPTPSSSRTRRSSSSTSPRGSSPRPPRRATATTCPTCSRVGRARGRCFVVHRIDLDTSGLLVLAKTPDANRALSARFRDHDIERVYLTVVAGAFPSDVAHNRSAGRRPARGHARRGPRAARRTARRCSPAGSRRAARIRSASTLGSGIPSSATPATAGPGVRPPPGWRCTPRRWDLRTRAMDAR